MDSTNPDLSAFKAHGGKLIMLEHMADYAQSPYAGIGYFQQVQKRMGEATVADFMRLYAAPGVDHVGSGGPSNVDMLSCSSTGWRMAAPLKISPLSNSRQYCPSRSTAHCRFASGRPGRITRRAIHERSQLCMRTMRQPRSLNFVAGDACSRRHLYSRVSAKRPKSPRKATELTDITACLKTVWRRELKLVNIDAVSNTRRLQQNEASRLPHGAHTKLAALVESPAL